MNLLFILVEPAVPENVGSSARALKTMGFDNLAVVNSDAYKLPEARWLAHGSSDLLDNIHVFGSLEEAVSGFDLVIGTTAKKRRIQTEQYMVSEIPELIRKNLSMLDKVAIVFGREESGLTNSELGMCHIITHIPMKCSYPSLNLAQSVMILAWELSRLPESSSPLTCGPEPEGDHSKSLILGQPAKSKSVRKFRHLRNSVSGTLIKSGYDTESPLYNRIMERIEKVGDKDASLIMSVCAKIDEIIIGKQE